MNDETSKSPEAMWPPKTYEDFRSLVLAIIKSEMQAELAETQHPPF